MFTSQTQNCGTAITENFISMSKIPLDHGFIHSTQVTELFSLEQTSWYHLAQAPAQAESATTGCPGLCPVQSVP